MEASKRHDVDSIRTNRPDDQGLPSVAEVLAHPAFEEGDPQVLAGEAHLNTKVRWVHASDSLDVARLLEGGELLLSTGAGWPLAAESLEAFVRSLVDSGLAGLVIELGTPFDEMPTALVGAARSHGLVLVALRREVRFVALTEAIHRRILSAQLDALRASAEVRERFTTYALRGSPADFVVAQLARTLGAPVVLENLAHEVITAEVPSGSPGEVLADWQARSREAHLSTSDDGWEVVPVDARNTRWGNLVALPGPAHPAGRRAVLEHGAIALAVGRLAAGGADEWAQLGRRRLLQGLIEGRYNTTREAEAQLEASGLPVAGRVLFGIAITGRPVTGPALEQAVVGIGGIARAWARGTTEGTVALVSLPPELDIDEAEADQIIKALGDHPRLTLTIGRAARGLDEALTSVRDAIEHARDRGPRVRWSDERPLAHLVNSLRDDYRLLDHAERMLAPLIEYDDRHDGDLLDVLEAMVAHPGNRTEAAKASHLSRSVFYQRLQLISSLLELDLDEGDTMSGLHIALLTYRGARGRKKPQ